MWFAFSETKKKICCMVPNDRCPAIFRRQRMEFPSKTWTDKIYLLLLKVVTNSKGYDFHLLVQENVENSRLRFKYFCLIMWLKHIYIYSVHFLIEKWRQTQFVHGVPFKLETLSSVHSSPSPSFRQCRSPSSFFRWSFWKCWNLAADHRWPTLKWV